MNIVTTSIDNSLAELPLPERDRLVVYGTRLLFAEMKGRFVLAERELAHFEQKYGMVLDKLNEIGLPENAGLEAHEDYVEWSGWQASYDKTNQIIKTLNSILEVAGAIIPER